MGKRDPSYHVGQPDDQLQRIFDVIGTPPDEDIAPLTDDAKRYVRLFEVRVGTGFRSKLPHVDPDSLDLLEKMLCFNAHERLDAQGALGHAVLAEVEHTGNPIVATTP